MKDILRTNPVRLYAAITAAGTLGSYFLPSGGWPLIVGFVIAVATLILGEGVRSQVYSQETHAQEVDGAYEAGVERGLSGD